jgi:hypothetical protein
MPEYARNKWRRLATIFRNLGDGLALECENLDTISDEPEYDALYTNYAQLVHTVQAGRRFISTRFDAIDGGDNA